MAQRTQGFALRDLRSLCRVIWCKTMAARISTPSDTTAPISDEGGVGMRLPWAEHMTRLTQYVRPEAIAVYPPLATPAGVCPLCV